MLSTGCRANEEIYTPDGKIPRYLTFSIHLTNTRLQFTSNDIAEAGVKTQFDDEKNRLISVYTGKANMAEYTDIPTFNF